MDDVRNPVIPGDYNDHAYNESELVPPMFKNNGQRELSESVIVFEEDGVTKRVKRSEYDKYKEEMNRKCGTKKSLLNDLSDKNESKFAEVQPVTDKEIKSLENKKDELPAVELNEIKKVNKDDVCASKSQVIQSEYKTDSQSIINERNLQEKQTLLCKDENKKKLILVLMQLNRMKLIINKMILILMISRT